MITITFNSEKGGTGKTTLSTHLAAGLALRGARVLLIDADPQGNATLNLGLRKEPGFYRLLVSEDYDLTSVVREVHPDVYQMPGEEVKGRLYCVPGNRESYGIPTIVTETELLAEILDEVDGIDFTIIDTPPTPGLLIRLIYEASDVLIVPTELELLSLDGLMGILSILGKLDLDLLGIIPNKYRKSTSIHDHNFSSLSGAAQKQSWPLFPPVSLRTNFAVASQNQRMVWVLSPESKATEEAFAMVQFAEERMRTWLAKTS
jgi:chromosome partitioning protein